MGPQLSQVFSLGEVDLAGGGSSNNLFVFIPMRILKIGLIATTAITGGPASVQLTLTRASGTTPSPVVSNVPTLTVNALAVNQGIWLDVPGSIAPWVLFPCERMNFDTNVQPTTGVAQAFVEVEMLGFNNSDQRKWIANHPGTTSVGTPLEDLTKVTA